MSTFVVIPCLNEQETIREVVSEIKKYLPNSKVVVVDNGSHDDTVIMARKAGAIVVNEPTKGKGFAVRKAFSLIPTGTTSIFMVDGDATYGLEAINEAVEMVELFGFDMVVGKRLVSKTTQKTLEYRPGHKLGNLFLSKIFQNLFQVHISDTLSGWRVMSVGFVKSFPGGASRFELEAELNAHVHSLNTSVGEIEVSYSERPPNSHSKLRTYSDGFLILRRNLSLFKNSRPLLAFSLLATPWLVVGTTLIVKVIAEYLKIKLVPHFPSLIVGVTCVLVSSLLWTAGIIIERIRLQRCDLMRLVYMAESNKLFKE